MKTKKENLYLEEDQDLIDRLKSIGPMSTGQVADQQKFELNSIQIETLLRSRKSMDDYDRNSTRFSTILAIFAIIQLVIAVMQFGLDASDKKWIGIVYIVVLSSMILWMMKVFGKKIKD